MNTYIASLIERLKNEPSLVIGVLASAIVGLAGSYGIVLDEPTLESVLTPILVGLAVRFKVTPTRTLTA